MKLYIYRFEKNETARIDTIKEKSIWLSTPKAFNDLVDSLLESVWLTNTDENTCNALKEGFDFIHKLTNRYRFPFPQDVQNAILDLLPYCHPTPRHTFSEIDDDEEQQKKLAGKVSDYIRETSGVCCFFAGAARNPLMWAHYADSHRGFCVEYVVDTKDTSNLFEVNYTTKPETPSIEELLFCPHQVIGRILMRKGHEWSYEKEYRLIYINEINSNEPGKIFPLPESFTQNKIITGANFINGEGNLNVNNLGIPIISYHDFIKEESQCQKPNE